MYTDLGEGAIHVIPVLRNGAEKSITTNSSYQEYKAAEKSKSELNKFLMAFIYLNFLVRY